MTLEGPEKIEISDKQLKSLKDTYENLASEMDAMIDDFFSPFKLMRDENIFSGASATAYTEFCTLAHQYTEVRYEMILSELEQATKLFTEKINEVEDYTI